MDPFTITAALLTFGGIAAVSGANAYGEAAGKETGKNIVGVAIVGAGAFLAFKYLHKKGIL